MKELNFLADLTGVDLSIVYSLNNVSNDESRDISNDYYSNTLDNNISDEEIKQILKENGLYRTWY